jgi:Undecaprenyl-phosphate glucose phosphotransferase
MAHVTESMGDGARAPSHTALVIGQSFGVVALVADVLAIVGASIASGVAYHAIAHNGVGQITDFAGAGGLMALLYVALQSLRKAYDLRRLSAATPGFYRVFTSWNLALFGLLLAGFLTKQTGQHSRGALVSFYGLGLLLVLGLRALFCRVLHRGVSEGWLATSRVLLVGTPDKLREFESRYHLAAAGFKIVGHYPLPDASLSEGTGQMKLATTLLRAVEGARRRRVDDVFILVPWSDEDLIDRCAEAFMAVPAHVHLGPEPVLDRFADSEVARHGEVPSLSLVRPPLQPIEVLSKRALDITVAGLALVLLLPVMAAIALAIKLDTPGPVLFRQRRSGFNQDTFGILKFRSMTTLDDGPVIRQVEKDDTRITRVGRWLRRSNLDELPQLWNVIRGDMSIVGPRPHALAHNDEFEKKIAFYARRHNVKPGITGWAQVNGFRGETRTDDKMRARVACDLYYIDHWSLGFDLYIMARTVLSPRAFKNAR